MKRLKEEGNDKADQAIQDMEEGQWMAKCEEPNGQWVDAV